MNNNNNNNNKPHVSFKEPEIDKLLPSASRNEMNYQRLSRFDFPSSMNGAIENKSIDHSSRSLSELGYESTSINHPEQSTTSE